MKLVETINNIWKIDDLRKRLITTFLFVVIYRFCSFIVIPGIDPAALASLHSQTREGIMSLLDMFSGGAFSNASVVALGIMPYISASIVMQLLGMFIPYFQKLQREGESGRTKMNQYTRYLTIAVLILQAPAYLANLSVQMGYAGTSLPGGFWFKLSSVVILTAGSMFTLWIGERITDKGIGNGVSMIILIGIIARFPQAFFQEFVSRYSSTAAGGLVMLLAEVVLLLAVTIISILLVQGTRKIPVQYAKRVVGNKQYGGARNYIPLKVNAAGVMPIIFAQALMFIPLAFIGYSDNPSGGFVRAFTDMYGFWYNFVFALLVIVFTWFYTAIMINPVQMAEEMKRNNGFIPGQKPGKRTAEYVDTIMTRITVPGSIFLAFVAIMPVFAHLFGINSQFSQFFGGTSLLIIVGVVLDTLQQIESHLLMHHYDGLLKSGGRIKGKTGNIAAY